jgi:tetratricopeptide (TPR) repeat protein
VVTPDDAVVAIEINPSHGLAYSNRGQARAQLGDRDGALKDLETALGLEPSRKDKIQAAIDRIKSSPAGAQVPEPLPQKTSEPNAADEAVFIR